MVARLALEDTVDDLVASLDADGPGCIIRVVVDGQPVAIAARGFADIEYAVPIGDDVPMYVASVAKQFTGAVVSELVEEGTLHPDQPVGLWLPGMAPALGSIALHHLVHHTSGIRDVYPLAALAGVPDEHLGCTDRMLALISRQRTLEFSPGTRHSYSNSNYILLAAIIEAATGVPLSQAARHRIFMPLGMTRTAFGDRSECPGYLRSTDGWTRRAVAPSVPGPAGLTSTARDLARWHEHLISQPSLVARLAVNRPLISGVTHRYGYGLAWEQLGSRTAYSHSGFLPGWAAEALVVPAANLSVVCLASTSGVAAVTLARRAAAAALGHPGVSTPRPGHPPAAGVYLSDDRRSVVRVTHEGGQALVASGGAALGISLRPEPTPLPLGAPRVLVAGDQLTISNQWVPPERFTLVGDEPGGRLVAGEFANDDLGITMLVDGDGLFINGAHVPLQPVAGNIWWGQYPVLGLPLDLIVHQHVGDDGPWLELNLTRAHRLRFQWSA